MAEPVSLEDIKCHLVLDPDDDSENANLEGMIVAARRACELRTRRAIVAEALWLAGLAGVPAPATR